MIIPAPKFQSVPLHLSGLSFFEKIKKVCNTPPRVQLTEDFIITLDDGLELVFPKGFITDLASAPRIFWLFPGFSPFGLLLTGAVAHDFGYQYGYFLTHRINGVTYPVPSNILYCDQDLAFGTYMPIFVGRNQEYFDQFLEGVTIEATGATFVAKTAKFVLSKFGHHAWDKYRELGPTAFGSNCLGLPGITKEGVTF